MQTRSDRPASYPREGNSSPLRIVTGLFLAEYSGVTTLVGRLVFFLVTAAVCRAMKGLLWLAIIAKSSCSSNPL